ncbi:MAG: HAMP domain-containing protein [Acidimicrobiales bacterium]
MRVGTKLAAILLAPLVVLGVLAGLGIADRAQAAAELRNAEREAILTARNHDLQNALQIEQLWAATSLSRPNQTVQDRFDDAVAASDAAAAWLNDAVAQLSRSSELDEYLQTVADRLAGLEGLRPAIKSRSATVDAILTGYDQVGTSLIGLQAATAGNIDVAELSNNLDDASTLAKAKATKARRDALLSVLNTSTDEAAKQGYAAEINGLDADTSRYLAQFYEEADPDYRALLRNAEAASDARTVEDAATQMLAGRTVDSLNFTEASVSRLAGMLSVEERITTDVSSLAATSRADATRTAQLYLAGAVAGILLAVAVAFFVARSITRPLRRLTEAADRLATDQLPGLVDQLRAGATDVNLSYTPIELGTRDELGQLATSFNTVQQVTVEVAHEQSALLRKGISDIFVNLARRNQALLDRQIEFIDQLEANERDPDQLENLFRLDHLATRMRRNAESLLVLAGADPVRRRGRPVPLADVIRVAVGEVADYSRIRVRDLEDVTVNSAAAVDVAHLLAELMENATQFSPPNTQVEISGYFDRSGSLGYAVSVTDQGIGISPEHLHEFNDLLADPPAMGLDMSRSLGFVVIGRLAKRHGVDVRLSSPHEGGVLATVLLPEAILGSGRSGATTASGLPSRRGEVADPGAWPLRRACPGPTSCSPTTGPRCSTATPRTTPGPTARLPAGHPTASSPPATAAPGRPRHRGRPCGGPRSGRGVRTRQRQRPDAAQRSHAGHAACCPPAAEPAPIGAEAESFTYYDVEEGYGRSPTSARRRPMSTHPPPSTARHHRHHRCRRPRRWPRRRSRRPLRCPSTSPTTRPRTPSRRWPRRRAPLVVPGGRAGPRRARTRHVHRC